MSEPIVVIRNLAKGYTSGSENLSILTGINLVVQRGASVAIRGESGSGKSTLLNILGGLDRPDTGTVTVGALELSSLPERSLTGYRSRHVGFIFQFHFLLKDFTALENVMLPAYIGGCHKKEAMERARSLIAELGLEARSFHYPSQLSGGERQRVAVARSLVNDPDLVLADEPTGNLDPRNSSLVADLLYLCAEKRGKTLIVVTHDEVVSGRAQLSYKLESGFLSPLDGQ